MARKRTDSEINDMFERWFTGKPETKELQRLVFMSAYSHCRIYETNN